MDDILNYKRCDEDDFYLILGCDESSTAEQILVEYKALSLQYHPDKNPNDPNAVIKFQKIQNAKEYLTDPEKRLQYDKWRRCGFCMPFEKYINLNKAAHTSMHWVSKKQKEMMLEGPEGNTEDIPQTCGSPRKPTGWDSAPGNDMLRRFRNYEI